MCIVLSPGYTIKPEMLQPNDVLFFFQLYFLHSTVICYLKSNKTNPVLTNGSAFMEFKSILIRSLLMKSYFSYTHSQTQTVLSLIHFMSFPLFKVPFFVLSKYEHVQQWYCRKQLLIFSILFPIAYFSMNRCKEQCKTHPNTTNPWTVPGTKDTGRKKETP